MKSRRSFWFLLAIHTEWSSLVIYFLKFKEKIVFTSLFVFFNWNSRNWWRISSRDMYWKRLKFIFMSLSFKRKIYFTLIYWSSIIRKMTLLRKTLTSSFRLLLSNKNEDFDFYKLMTKHMIYKNYKDKIDIICHDKND